jgi:hypothetical protein
MLTTAVRAYTINPQSETHPEAPMENMKQCPCCAEEIKSEAVVCRYCHSDLRGVAKEKAGRFIKVRLKTGEQTYAGDLFVPDYLNRVSDVLNDTKHFIILANSVEETRIRDVAVGFVAINKSLVEWIRLMEVKEPEDGGTFRANIAP